MQARRMVRGIPLRVVTRMVSPSPTETRETSCGGWRALVGAGGRDRGRGGVLAGGATKVRMEGFDGAPPEALPVKDRPTEEPPPPHRRSQGMPSRSPSICLLPFRRDSIASAQVRKVEHRCAEAGREPTKKKASNSRILIGPFCTWTMASTMTSEIKDLISALPAAASGVHAFDIPGHCRGKNLQGVSHL
jgi:hypothetical protein